MDGIDAVGDAVTGGLLAHAVEPATGEADGHTHEKVCLNCGTPLTGPYCPQCGQKAHVHRSLRGFFHDLVHGLFNFEGKIWHTLPMLAWRPGELTRRYIAGERARFVSPVALYLFTVFAMFAALNFTGALTPSHGKALQDRLRTNIAEDTAAVAKLEAKRKVPGVTTEDVADLDRRIAKRKKEIVEEQQALATGKSLAVGDATGAPGWIRPFIEDVKDNPEVASMKIQDAASKFSWLLIPISVPFLWLLFPLRRRYNLYDHTVFVTYSVSFMMMLLVVGSLLVMAGFSTLGALLFFVPPFHMYRQLRGAYQLGKFSAIMRTMALVTFAFAAAGMFMAATVAIATM